MCRYTYTLCMQKQYSRYDEDDDWTINREFIYFYA